MRGDVSYVAHIAQESANDFYEKLQGKLAEGAGLDVEVQYNTVIQHTGLALFSAVIIGRLR